MSTLATHSGTLSHSRSMLGGGYTAKTKQRPWLEGFTPNGKAPDWRAGLLTSDTQKI